MKAVCLGCGGPKWGALTTCPACGMRPDTPDAEARHLLASDEHLDDAGLDAVAEAVRAGRPVPVDADRLSALTAELAGVRTAPLWFALLVGAAPLGLLVLLALGALALSAWTR